MLHEWWQHFGMFFFFTRVRLIYHWGGKSSEKWSHSLVSSHIIRLLFKTSGVAPWCVWGTTSYTANALNMFLIKLHTLHHIGDTKKHFYKAALSSYSDTDIMISLTLLFQRPAQSCVCGWLATESCSQTQWGRRSAPERRTPSHHSNWMRNSGCQCSTEKQKKKSRWSVHVCFSEWVPVSLQAFVCSKDSSKSWKIQGAKRTWLVKLTGSLT